MRNNSEYALGLSAILTLACIVGGLIFYLRLPTPRYGVTLLSLTPKKLGKLVVYLDDLPQGRENGRVLTFRQDIAPGHCTSRGHYDDVLPRIVTVRWTEFPTLENPAGMLREAKIDMRNVCPSRPVAMDLYFVVHLDDTVTAHAVDSRDMEGHMDITIEHFRYRDDDPESREALTKYIEKRRAKGRYDLMQKGIEAYGVMTGSDYKIE